MTLNRDFRVLVFSFFQLRRHPKAMWFTSLSWWLIKSHFFWPRPMLEETMGKVLPALPRGHAQFKPGTDCLSSQDCVVNTFFSFLLKFQRVWGLLLYFLTGFFVLWSGQKRQSWHKSDVHVYLHAVCMHVKPLAWSLSSVFTPFFHSSICSWRGLIRPSKKVLVGKTKQLNNANLHNVIIAALSP